LERYDCARIEGYWGGLELPHLPMPEAKALPWNGQGEFLEALRLVQRSASGLERMNFMGTLGVSSLRLQQRLYGVLRPADRGGLLMAVAVRPGALRRGAQRGAIGRVHLLCDLAVPKPAFATAGSPQEVAAHCCLAEASPNISRQTGDPR
jgi:hypothetical protein